MLSHKMSGELDYRLESRNRVSKRNNTASKGTLRHLHVHVSLILQMFSHTVEVCDARRTLLNKLVSQYSYSRADVLKHSVSDLYYAWTDLVRDLVSENDCVWTNLLIDSFIFAK